MRRLGVCSSLGCRAKRRGWLVRVPSREIEYELISLAIQLPILSFSLSLSLALSLSLLYFSSALPLPLPLLSHFVRILVFLLVCANESLSSTFFVNLRFEKPLVDYIPPRLSFPLAPFYPTRCSSSSSSLCRVSTLSLSLSLSLIEPLS